MKSHILRENQIGTAVNDILWYKQTHTQRHPLFSYKEYISIFFLIGFFQPWLKSFMFYLLCFYYGLYIKLNNTLTGPYLI